MRIYVIAGLAILLTGSGCGGGLPLAPVKGEVKLDGRPLSDATVQFQPITAKGSTSVGETDSDGEFVLSYTKDRAGAIIGKHKVRINTSKVTTSESGAETHVVEKVPDRYNLKTELEYEVKPGNNEFDIELRSGGVISTVTDPAMSSPRPKAPGDCS